jgi:hypothetical protein
MMDQKTRKYLIYYSAAAALFFFGVMFLYTGFKFSAPLDDAFIYFQYAKNLSHGHFFEYVAGQGYSSGATSFLYAFILAPFALLFKGSSIIIVSYIIGAVTLFYSSYFIFMIMRKLTENTMVSSFAAALFATNGNILWGYFSGMEIGLFSMLLAASLYAIAYDKSLKFKITFLTLLAIVRPEGFMAVLILSAIAFINRLISRKNEHFFPYMIPVAAGLSYFIINYIFTGDFMPNTMRAKSNFSLNYFYYTDILKQGLDYYLDFISRIFNGGSGHYFPPYSYFFFLLAILPGMIKEVSLKKGGFFTVSFFWFFLGVMSTVFSSFATVHNYRYSMPFIIIFCIFLSYGLWYAVEKITINHEKQKTALMTAVFSLFIIFNVFTVWANAVNFGRDCRDILAQSISAGRWIKANIPAGETIAINDAGAITYFSDAKIFDLVGLATNKEAVVFRDGMGTVFEEMEHIRPKYWMVHLGWFNYERFTLFKKPRLVTFNLEKEPAYFVVGSPEVGVETDFTLFNSGDTMKDDHSEKGVFVLVDTIDVADIRDESKHSYKIFTKGPPNLPGTMLEEEISAGTDIRILEAGRITGGGEEFTLTGLTPGADLKIVRRVYESPRGEQLIYVDGIKAADWKYMETDKTYHEQEVIISGTFIKSASVRLKLEEISLNRYNSFHYWFLQRRK